MKVTSSSIFTLFAFAAAQATPNPPPAGRPAPAPPAGAPPGPAPLEPAVPAAPTVPATPATPEGNPLVSMIKSGFANPAFTPNPIVSIVQSVFEPAPAPTPTTYKSEPISFALSDISFASTLVPAPKPTIDPADPDSTPGDVLFCTSTTYDSWAGDAGDGICDVVQSELNKCRNLSEALRKKVTAVRPDKGQLCLVFDDDDCYGKAEWVKWPGVQNLRGRIGDGGSWQRRIVSFRCSTED